MCGFKIRNKKVKVFLINKSKLFLAGFKLLILFILLCVYFGEIVDLQTFSPTIHPSDIYKKVISFKNFNPFEVFTVTSFSCLASSTSPQMKWLVFRVTIGIVSSIICLSYSLCYQSSTITVDKMMMIRFFLCKVALPNRLTECKKSSSTF